MDTKTESGIKYDSVAHKDDKVWWLIDPGATPGAPINRELTKEEMRSTDPNYPQNKKVFRFRHNTGTEVTPGEAKALAKRYGDKAFKRIKPYQNTPGDDDYITELEGYGNQELQKLAGKHKLSHKHYFKKDNATIIANILEARAQGAVEMTDEEFEKYEEEKKQRNNILGEYNRERIKKEQQESGGLPQSQAPTKKKKPEKQPGSNVG